MTDRMTFAVLGPGGVGGLLAALLARSGESVEVIAGDETAREIEAHGIRVESERFGNFTAAVTASARLEQPVDAVLVTVKATQLQIAMRRAPVSAVGNAAVVPFLNGFEHVEILRHVYPNVVPATIAIESTRIGPGVIRQTSPFAAVAMVGAQALADRFRATGLDVRVTDDENQMLWDKFAVLGPIALLTTAARANVGVIRTERREELVALIDEVAAVAAAERAPIDRAAILRTVDSAHGTLESSMQRDQAAGRALELDALGGALLRKAARLGIDTPVARRLIDEIEARKASRSA